MRMDGYVIMRTTKVKIKKLCVIQNIGVKKSEESMYRCGVVILASKKYATLNISELEFLDFPGILRQNGKTQRLFSDLECQI